MQHLRIIALLLISLLLVSLTACSKSPEEKARTELKQMNIDYTEESFIKHVEKGDKAVINLFLTAGMSPNLRKGGSDKEPILNIAATYGHIEIVNLLLAKGADVNTKDIAGNTTLTIATRGGHTEIVTLLLAKGADLTATNEKTGLMWTRDANIAKEGMKWEDAFKFIENLNKQKYAGYSDWRLPTVKELRTHARSEYFKKEGVFKNVKRFDAYYWSSTIYSANRAGAWGVNMELTNEIAGPKTNILYVWPVRAASGVIPMTSYGAGEERFVFSDLTVTDKKTGLMWTRDANIDNNEDEDYMKWKNAFKFIEKLNKQKYAGYSDWRLPKKEELQTLVDYAKGQGYDGTRRGIYQLFNKIGFRNVEDGGYWSSSTYASNPAYALSVFMTDGHVSPVTKSWPYYVWPVRGGK